MSASTHISQSLFTLNVFPHDKVFHTHSRIPLTFELNLNRRNTKTCISKCCFQLPEHSRNSKTGRKPFFYRKFSEHLPQCFRAVEILYKYTFETNSNPFELGQIKFLILPSNFDITFHRHRTILIPFKPKEPLLYRHLRKFMQFSDLINCDTSKSNNHANSDSYTFNSDDSSSDDETFPQP